MNALARVLAALSAWSVALACAVAPLPFGGTWIGLFLSVVLWLGVGAASVALLRPLGRGAGAVAGTVTVVLAVFFLNWVAVSPRLWFYVHWAAYEAAASSASVDDGSYYGTDLPLHWRWLTVDGRVVDKEGALFFPQWYGIPDDGGGFFHSPGGSPVGTDMAGMLCRNPRRLGGDWWMCGLRG